ncbi:uncharacterized protein LOC132259161 [Phlebotomus argentipes]|uniref:uncharacterized protein LOC132259161 n=1 Tax=Phlebotomus argentipes TaxID=94469 RepID=UPI00289341C8|nr:uncharacterized protein LOC132259161 [Phlebotomus argentipes]
MVVNYEDIKNIFIELRKFYTEEDNLLVKEARRRHNSTHIQGITYGVIFYWTMFWFSEILLQVFIREVGGIPYPMQYYIPFLSPSNPYFHLTNAIFQNILFFAGLTVMAGSDCMIIMFAFQFRSELVSLEEVISKLEDIEIYKKNKDILITAYRMHLKLLNMFQQLSDVYFYMSFSQVLSTFIGTTFLFYVVVMYGLDIAHFIIIVVVICQIFILCLFGEIIFAKMSALPNALYLTKWYEFTPKDKWKLLYILHNAQRPCGLKAVGIVDVSIYTFVESFVFCAGFMAISASDCMIIMFAFQFRSELVSLEEVIAKLEDTEVYKENRDILITAYRMHLKLLNMFHHLTDMLFYMSFSQILSTFIGTTFLFYVVFMYGLDIAHTVIIVMVICQIFTFCLFGEIIFAKMSELPNAFYLTKWYDFAPEDKWKLLHILHNAQKPCGLKAVGIVDVSIYTFVELVKLSGSYCAIIHALSNKGTSTGQ